MSLRMRLSLAFVFVVLAPLLIAAVLVARGVPESGTRAASLRAQTAATGAAALLGRQCVVAEQMAHAIAWEAQANSPARAVADGVRQGAGYVAVLRVNGTVADDAGTLTVPARRQVAQASPAALGSCDQGAGASPYVTAARVAVRTAGGHPRGRRRATGGILDMGDLLEIVPAHRDP